MSAITETGLANNPFFDVAIGEFDGLVRQLNLFGDTQEEKTAINLVLFVAPRLIRLPTNQRAQK